MCNTEDFDEGENDDNMNQDSLRGLRHSTSSNIRGAESFLKQNRIKLVIAPDKLEEISKLQREHEELANLARLRAQNQSPVRHNRFGEDQHISVPNPTFKVHRKIKEV